MNLTSRLSRLEGSANAAPPSVTLVAVDEADARDQLERLMLGAGGPATVTLQVSGKPAERFMIRDKPHEYWVERMEALQ